MMQTKLLAMKGHEISKMLAWFLSPFLRNTQGKVTFQVFNVIEKLPTAKP
jgi:hypothetical protein